MGQRFRLEIQRRIFQRLYNDLMYFLHRKIELALVRPDLALGIKGQYALHPE